MIGVPMSRFTLFHVCAISGRWPSTDMSGFKVTGTVSCIGRLSNQSLITCERGKWKKKMCYDTPYVREGSTVHAGRQMFHGKEQALQSWNLESRFNASSQSERQKTFDPVQNERPSESVWHEIAGNRMCYRVHGPTESTCLGFVCLGDKKPVRSYRLKLPYAN